MLDLLLLYMPHYLLAVTATLYLYHILPYNYIYLHFLFIYCVLYLCLGCVFILCLWGAIMCVISRFCSHFNVYFCVFMYVLFCFFLHKSNGQDMMYILQVILYSLSVSPMMFFSCLFLSVSLVSFLALVA